MQKKKIHTKFDSILAKKKELRFRLTTRDGRQEYFKFMSVLNYCLNQLTNEYREILEESYLNPKFRFWWVDKYCKSSFYRKRVTAISSFVRLFDLIYENYPHFSVNISSAIS